ncbi:hypothetical protein NP233_g11188 [Leucocoprinus birnbaumii]|uniref:Nephrocystin 3-like N-terminal domain-containing protein n=1 Tax=Leucocoprinus birnbaumii TaxID=56174 RepID=A0AAD5VHW1_9AGAR|nr:hypothetical protein NP233_g11188 [Leucocoprinus birnbaumii]
MSHHTRKPFVAPINHLRPESSLPNQSNNTGVPPPSTERVTSAPFQSLTPASTISHSLAPEEESHSAGLALSTTHITPVVTPIYPAQQHGMFYQAHSFVLNQPSFQNFSSYNSVGESNCQEPILWMRGPFGVGKSAVAQSCAEELERRKKLISTLFFSRSNANRDDPRRLFISIAFQIASRCKLFRDIIESHIQMDPSFASKSASAQFQELLVTPLSQSNVTLNGLDGCVVIIDGLDECRGTKEQCEIIRIIAASVQNHTTPFRWFITSRPEDHIIRTMNIFSVKSVISCIELPISRHIDYEILTYLTDEFEDIRQQHSLPDSWPSEETLALLVQHAAGLWIYVATIVRFIRNENSFGPQDQLRIVIDFLKDVSTKLESHNPLSEMDLFYTLILEQIPLAIRTTVRKLLLFRSVLPAYLVGFFGNKTSISYAIHLTSDQFERCSAALRSVVEFEGNRIQFYHTSFLDFMKDPERSKALCVHGQFLIEYRREAFKRLHGTSDESVDRSEGGVFRALIPIVFFWLLCEYPNHPLDSSTAERFMQLPFRKMKKMLNTGLPPIIAINGCRVRDNVSVLFIQQYLKDLDGFNYGNASYPLNIATRSFD